MKTTITLPLDLECCYSIAPAEPDVGLHGPSVQNLRVTYNGRPITLAYADERELCGEILADEKANPDPGPEPWEERGWPED